MRREKGSRFIYEGPFGKTGPWVLLEDLEDDRVTVDPEVLAQHEQSGDTRTFGAFAPFMFTHPELTVRACPRCHNDYTPDELIRGTCDQCGREVERALEVDRLTQSSPNRPTRKV